MLSSAINKNLWEDDDDDDEDDDFVPLVTAARDHAAASSSHGRAKNRRNNNTTNSQSKNPMQTQLEMAVFRQQHKERVANARDDDDNDDDDDENFCCNASLSSSSSMCWSDPRRLLASCFLALILIVPLAKRWYRHHHHSTIDDTMNNNNNNNQKQSSNDITSWPSDDLVCAKTTYHMNFSQLYHQVAHYESESSSFCTYPGTATAATTSKTPPQRHCYCLNPTLPNPVHPGREGQLPQWNLTFDRNLYLVQQHKQQQQQQQEPLDVLLLGDSITERWLGTSLMKPLHEHPEEYTQLFDELFTTKTTPRTPTAATSADDSDNNKKKKQKKKKKSNNDDNANKNKATPSLQGMALGIAGDRCPQLLYRLQNGELNFSSPPKVFWVLIGINDFLAGDCAKETVLVGLMRIIQELQQHLQQQQQQQHRRRLEQQKSSLSSTSSSSWIVMNSILPAGHLDNERGQVLWQSIQWVNHRLECYTKGLDHVEFYNATDLFLIPNPNKTNEENNNNNDAAAAAAAASSSSMIIDKSLMHDFLHPSPRGQRLWGEAIVKKVLELTKATTSP